MDILSLAILIFIIMESANVAILYFRPGSRIGNGVGVFNAFHNSEREEQKLFASYLVNWVAGVIFAYFTNRRFVFKSHEPMLKEIPKFVSSRISTFILELVIRQLFGILGINTYVTTLVSAVLVFIGNYVFSKLLVFKKK